MPVVRPRIPVQPGSQLPRVSSTYPYANPYTPPIPIPTENVPNLAACVHALKASVESLIGQRGDASNRAVTFNDLMAYGLLDPQAVSSPTGGTDLGGGGGGGGISEAPIDGFAYGRLDANWARVLLLTGGSINGNLVVTGTTTLGVTTVTTPPAADNSTNAATTAWVTSKGYLTSVGAGSIYAPINSPVFTGDPRAPTPSLGDNDTSLVTSAWVKGQNYLTGNQSISLTTDVTGSGTTTIASTVVGLRGRPVANIAPTTNQVLGWDGAQWLPATVSGGSGNYVLKTGDVMSGDLVVQTKLSVGTTVAPANTSVGMIWMSGSLVHNGGTAIFHNAVPTSAGTKHISTGGGAALNMGSAQFAFYNASGNAGAEVVWNLVGTLDASQLYVNSNIKIAGNYLTFVNAGYTVNTTGGPLIYADTSTMVFKQGSNGPNGFWWQNYTGYIVARITGDTARLQLFQIGSTANYVELYNDTNAHLNTPNALYVNWWSQQLTNFGGDINVYNSKYIYARGGRLRAHQGGNDNNYLEMFNDGNSHLNSSNPLYINYFSIADINVGGRLIFHRNAYGLYGTDTGGGTDFMIGILNDNLLWIGDGTHAINFQSGGTIPWLTCNGRLDNIGQIWCGSDIIMGNDGFLYGRTNGNNWYQIAGCSANLNYLGNATWDTIVRAAGTVVYQNIHVRSDQNNTKYNGHGGCNWYQVSAYNFYNPSDASLKHDVAEAPTCLDVVRAIKPKTYKYNDSPDTRTHWGFVAQDVAREMREAGLDFGGHIPVSEMNHHEGLAYHELTAVLWRAVQELAAKLEARDG